MKKVVVFGKKVARIFLLLFVYVYFCFNDKKNLCGKRKNEQKSTKIKKQKKVSFIYIIAKSL